ncbi:HAD family hydrolase [Rhizobium leguminosarum]|uniref:HAD family hydrolase n=1 Tax=Rhizobium leguminosarum TaxID=384 RepID=UPI002DD431F9|nr:HAD family hydrolase [Rhizobium leguminosarum]
MERDHGRPIIFIDFDGTICHDRYWRSLPLNKRKKLQTYLFQENRHIVFEWMRGRHTAEEVNGMVAAALDMLYDEVWEIFVADCQSMQVSPATLARLSRVRLVANVILVTGNMDSFSRFTVPALRLDQHFDAISNSYNEGRLKTDNGGALFMQYADQFGASIQDCAVVDDSEEVCSTFAQLGGTPLLVTAERTTDAILDGLLQKHSNGPDSF